MRAVLFLSVGLTLLGSCGVANGLGGVSADQPPPALELSGDDDEVSRATQDVSEAFRDVAWRNPHRRPLAAANIVVSVLLMLGSATLMMRRTSAVWWITQAVLANCVWIVAQAVSQSHALFAAMDRLRPSIEALDAATRAAEPEAVALTPEVAVIGVVVVIAVSAGISMTAHGLFAWRARRPDIREFLETGPQAAP